MLTRFVKTNGNNVIKQAKFLMWYRNVEYLDTPIRESEKKMNDAIAAFKKAYAEKEHWEYKRKEAEQYIKGSKHEMLNVSEAIPENFGFKKWLKSFVPLALMPEQSKDWEDVAKFLKKSHSMQTSIKSIKLTTVPVGKLEVKPTKQNGGGGKKNKGGNNQQQQNN